MHVLIHDKDITMDYSHFLVIKCVFKKEKNHQSGQTCIVIRFDSQQLQVWILAPRQQRALPVF